MTQNRKSSHSSFWHDGMHTFPALCINISMIVWLIGLVFWWRWLSCRWDPCDDATDLKLYKAQLQDNTSQGKKLFMTRTTVTWLERGRTKLRWRILNVENLPEEWWWAMGMSIGTTKTRRQQIFWSRICLLVQSLSWLLLWWQWTAKTRRERPFLLFFYLPASQFN